ncbi:DUF5662 family protein [Anaerorhabdus sp.]|uniref:DUF5662 family protein n=1 Tax=Anaerorhabdus sp. TaxID=1872524 RepID=UPI002FC8EA43
MRRKITLKNSYNHFMTITRHKIKVTRLCFKMGLYKQGLLHDLSKYSWVEFSSGARYYQGYRSPIDAEKEDIGYSLGWLHHKGKNKHHWEYWLDKNKTGVFPIEVPFNYVQEMICDRIAACMIYKGKDYTQSTAYDYFMNGTDRLYMHPNTAKKIEELLTLVKEYSLDEAFKKIKNMRNDEY